MSLSERLKFAMDRAALDDRSLAKEVSRLAGQNVAWQTIQSIRTGRSKSTKYGAYIARATGVDAHWFMTGVGQPDHHIQPTSDARTADNQYVLEAKDHREFRVEQPFAQYSAKASGVVFDEAEFMRDMSVLDADVQQHVASLVASLARKAGRRD